jgi:hypothetical protein
MMEKEAKSQECFSLRHTRRTLVSGATDARAAEKEASDVVVLL